MNTEITTPVASFGEVLVAGRRAAIQIVATSGLKTLSEVETFTASSGTAVASNTGTGMEFVCTTSTTANSYALLRSKRFMPHRPGQGICARFSARFPTPGVASSRIAAGCVSTGTELSFGYNGTDFGILYRTGGLLEIQTLTLSAGAGGNENVTVKLDGTDTVVAVTSGTATQVAVQLGAATYSGWTAYQNGATVVFIATTVGNKTGSMTLTSSGTTAGSFATTQNGSAVSDVFIEQTEWNIDRMDGNGPSRMDLDPAKGNMYQIQWGYDGYSEILFKVESPSNGKFMPVHRLQYANNYTSPALLQPSMKIGWFVASLGSTSVLSIAGASASGFVEGDDLGAPTNPFGYEASASGVGTSLTNVVAFRCRGIFNSLVNVEEMFPVFLSAAAEGTKPVICEVIINPTWSATPSWSYVDSTNSVAEYSTTSATLSVGSGQQILGFSLGKSGQANLNIADLEILLTRGDVIAIGLRATSGTADVVAGMTWLED